jgi:hypothetical protein
MPSFIPKTASLEAAEFHFGENVDIFHIRGAVKLYQLVRVYPGNRKCLRQAKYAYLKVTMCPY